MNAHKGVARVGSAAAGLLAASVLVAGCGAGSPRPSTSGAAEPTNGASEPSTATAPSTSLDGRVVYFVPGVMANPFYVGLECGIRDAAAKYGFEVQVQGATEWDPSLQTPIVNAVVSEKPAALLIAPTDSTAMFEPIAAASDAGIQVALVDTTLEDTSKVLTAVATDNTVGGAAAADALAELIGEKGKVMVVAFQAGATTSDERQRGFEEQIKKYPNIEYLGTQFSANDAANAAAIVTSTLAAHPDLAGIFANNDLSAAGAATGLREAGKIGDVKVVAFDASVTEAEQLQEGALQALIAQVPYEIGVEAVEAVAAALSGEAVEKAVTTKTVTITMDNFNSPESQAALYKPTCN